MNEHFWKATLDDIMNSDSEDGTGKLRRVDRMRKHAEKQVGGSAWLAYEAKIKKLDLPPSNIDIFHNAWHSNRGSVSRKTSTSEATRTEERRRGEAKSAMNQVDKMHMGFASHIRLESKSALGDGCDALADDVTKHPCANDADPDGGANLALLWWGKTTALLRNSGPFVMLAWPVWHWFGPRCGPNMCTCGSCSIDAS